MKKRHCLRNRYNEKTVQKAFGVLERYNKPDDTVPAQENRTLNFIQKNYPNIVKTLAQAIHLLGKQDRAFRRHRHDEKSYR